MSKRISNKRIKHIMESSFDGKFEHNDGVYSLVILEGYFGSHPVYCALHKTLSLTASQLGRD